MLHAQMCQGMPRNTKIPPTTLAEIHGDLALGTKVPTAKLSMVLVLIIREFVAVTGPHWPARLHQKGW